MKKQTKADFPELQAGFITMVLIMITVVVAVIFLAYSRVSGS